MSSAAQPYPIVHGLEVEDAKNALRSAIRTARHARSQRLREEAAHRFADVLESIPEVAEATCLAAYAARPYEPSTTVLLERLAARGAEILLPVLGAGLERGWALYAGADDLLERAPGRPPEPSTAAMGPEALEKATVVISPALAVDSGGIRLGQGGGWYDRALTFRRPDAFVVGLVFPEELYAADRPLPREPHDVAIDAVATTEDWHTLPLA